MWFVRTLARVAGFFALLLAPVVTSAHAFGQQYTLPLPLSLYVVGAGAALVASFAILGLFSRPGGHERMYVKTRVVSDAVARVIDIALHAVGLFVFSAALVAAFFGSAEASENPSLFLFWIGLLLMMTYASAVLAGLWERLDPFRTLARLLLGKNYEPLYAFPPRLRYIPAFAMYLFVLWFELLSFGAGSIPQNIGFMLLAYLVVTIFGIGLFGYRQWFRYGDFFAIFFGVVERFAPFQLTEHSVTITPPGERTLERSDSLMLLMFILLMLSSTAFDALRETQMWFDVMSASDLVLQNFELVSTMVLVVSPIAFLSLYASAVALMCVITKTKHRFAEMLLRFTFSLIPIVVAYNFAHYFTLILMEGQNFIPMLSDPLMRGWDLFGTAGYVLNPGLIDAATVWYTQVAVILVGHIIATYIAHRIALREFATRAHVILGQIPMLALMVVYTGFGLWILSLPFSL